MKRDSRVRALCGSGPTRTPRSGPSSATTGRSGDFDGGFYHIDDNGKVVVNFHPGQMKAWESNARFLAVLAGTRAGKTSWGPWWLKREIGRRGGGDYIAVTASFSLFQQRMLPAIRELFEHNLGWGRYWTGPKILELSDPATGEFRARRADDEMWGRIMLRSAEAPGGLEAARAKAIWADEAGQDSFNVGVLEALFRRVTLDQGRILFTTTLYIFGYMKTEIYDRAMGGDKDYGVVHFDSTENPAFPREEWERAERTMPPWRFAMQYRGRFERPAGMIFNSFDSATDVVQAGSVDIRPNWERTLGLDFGGVNTAGLFFAKDPATGIQYLYREYKGGERTAEEHVAQLKKGEAAWPPKYAVGGSKSEEQWRKEFKRGGLHVLRPYVWNVEVGIDRLYGAFKSRKIKIFHDCTGVLGQLASYSRKLDSAGMPTEDIENKSLYHYMDAARYASTIIFGPGPRVSRMS